MKRSKLRNGLGNTAAIGHIQNRWLSSVPLDFLPSRASSGVFPSRAHGRAAINESRLSSRLLPFRASALVKSADYAEDYDEYYH
jgi:hypothetical protein